MLIWIRNLFFLKLYFRELSFKKGDIILIKRHINNDWIEGEFQGKIGIFPVNHVEILHESTTSSSKTSNSNDLQQTSIEKLNTLPLQR